MCKVSSNRGAKVCKVSSNRGDLARFYGISVQGHPPEWRPCTLHRISDPDSNGYVFNKALQRTPAKSYIYFPNVEPRPHSFYETTYILLCFEGPVSKQCHIFASGRGRVCCLTEGKDFCPGLFSSFSLFTMDNFNPSARYANILIDTAFKRAF